MGDISIPAELIVCSYAAPNATSEAGKHVLIPRMADRRKNDVASTTEAHVRLAVVEQVTDAVNRVLEQRCRSKGDDTDLWIDKRDDVESGYESGDFPYIAEIFE